MTVRRLSSAVFISFIALMLALLGYPAVADDNTGPHIVRMSHEANRQNDSNTTHSDLAFWGNIMAQGTYEGFRLFNISNPSSPQLLSDFSCPGSQGDVSLHKAGDRLLLFRSVDAVQDRPQCAGSVAGSGSSTTYFEGIRIIDVTNPRKPKFIKGIFSDCGSHTHTTIRDTKNNRAIIYALSYPLGTPTADPDGAGQHQGCEPPHGRIGIIVVPNGAPGRARLHHYESLDVDPVLPNTPAEVIATPTTIGCHDVTVYTHPKVQTAAAACITEGQLWDISNPLQPCTDDDTCRTRIRNATVEIFHSSAFTWDAKVVLFGDEHAGGSGPGCEGAADPVGNVWFYENVEPGTSAGLPIGRYHIPRNETTESSCTMHNFNIIPIDGSRRYIGVSAAYGGGTTVFDFTGVKTAVSPLIPEVAFADRDAGQGDSATNGIDEQW
jgi:hypothetical protein